MRSIIVSVAVAAMLSSGIATAAPACRDKGKFVKCPPPHAAVAPQRCKDMRGKFAKCGLPGAKPV